MVVVISQLNSLVHDQIRRINTVRNIAAVFSFTMEADQAVEHAVLDQTSVDELRLPESIVYMTFCNSPGLQRVHISAKEIFHAPLHPSNKIFLSPRVFPKRAQGKRLGTRLVEEPRNNNKRPCCIVVDREYLKV